LFRVDLAAAEALEDIATAVGVLGSIPRSVGLLSNLKSERVNQIVQSISHGGIR